MSPSSRTRYSRQGTLANWKEWVSPTRTHLSLCDDAMHCLKMMTHLRLFQASAIVLMSTLLGCSRVQPEQIAGTWILKDSSRSVLPANLRRGTPRIVLDKDGTFVASDVPALFEFPGHRDARLESGKGEWRIASTHGNPEVRLDFKEIDQWNPNELPYGTQLRIAQGVLSKVTLFYFLGDPDEGRIVSFERREGE
jgi:hypothetical protein